MHRLGTCVDGWTHSLGMRAHGCTMAATKTWHGCTQTITALLLETHQECPVHITHGCLLTG
eukprot:10815905-Lingulodinium_polyedra.AAC.1